MEFSDIALAKFLETAPNLGPFIVNFSEVDAESGQGDSGVRVGIFVLDTPAGICYVPVIGKGDTVFPIDSIFLEAESLFKPLSSSTISYIITSASPAMGTPKKIPDNVRRNPSLYTLVNPPKTGKFVYASASRLAEFMAIVPAPTRQAMLEKISSEESVYNSLDKLFGLRAIFAVLNKADSSNNNIGTGPSMSGGEVVKVLTTPQEVKSLGDESVTAHFLQKGYAIHGSGINFRTAVPYSVKEYSTTYKEVEPSSDGNADFNIVFRGGDVRPAFLPQYHVVNPVKNVNRLVSVFVDGSYARGPMIAMGSMVDRAEVLDTLFRINPPKLLRDLNRGDFFLLFTSSGQALGPFTADSVVRSARGTEVKIYENNIRKICGFDNFKHEAESINDTLYVPHNVFVLTLTVDVSNDLERTAYAAADTREMLSSQLLGEEMMLRFDGVEFSNNRGPLGNYGNALKVLVEKENLDPVMAETFLKQAEEDTLVRLFLSKSASSAGTDTRPTEISQYGNTAQPVGDVGLNGSFLNNLQQATNLGDPQAVECSIISQLLQVPALFEYIQEYLPEIEQTVDRLGRILFLTRVKVDQMSQSLDSDSVFSVISQIKTVYRQLGDASFKLKGYVTSTVGVDSISGTKPSV